MDRSRTDRADFHSPIAASSIDAPPGCILFHPPAIAMVRSLPVAAFAVMLLMSMWLADKAGGIPACLERVCLWLDRALRRQHPGGTRCPRARRQAHPATRRLSRLAADVRSTRAGVCPTHGAIAPILRSSRARSRSGFFPRSRWRTERAAPSAQWLTRVRAPRTESAIALTRASAGLGWRGSFPRTPCTNP